MFSNLSVILHCIVNQKSTYIMTKINLRPNFIPSLFSMTSRRGAYLHRVPRGYIDAAGLPCMGNVVLPNVHHTRLRYNGNSNQISIILLFIEMQYIPINEF